MIFHFLFKHITETWYTFKFQYISIKVLTFEDLSSHRGFFISVSAVLVRYGEWRWPGLNNNYYLRAAKYKVISTTETVRSYRPRKPSGKILGSSLKMVVMKQQQNEIISLAIGYVLESGQDKSIFGAKLGLLAPIWKHCKAVFRPALWCLRPLTLW